MTEPRTIRLRRPPTLSLLETPFVPKASPSVRSGEVLAEVDRRWAALCSAKPSLHDGRICHVLGVHRNGHGGASIHIMDCAYRFHAVQDESFDLGVRHLGVKGMTIDSDRVLLGRRSSQVRLYPCMWEFAPGGMVEPGADPAETLRQELAEETGLSAVSEPTPIAIIYDPVVRCWEIIYQLGVTDRQPNPATDEYAELRWCKPGDWPQPLSPPSRQIAALLVNE
jgi:8-oxo-dGTP pyrophosphatase MutT (NUDIX family)